MKSRWKSFGELEPGREYLALASSIPAKKRSSTWKMFRGSRIVGEQLANTDGVLGFSLLAQPLTMTYATLSVWTGEESLATFTTTSPHREMMSELVALLGPTKFVRWTIAGAGGRPSWSDALARLA